MRGTILVIIVMAVVTVGCTGTDSAETPDGFTPVEAPFATMAYPPGWDVQGQSDTEIRVLQPDVEGLPPSAALTLDDAFTGGEAEFEAAVQGTLTVLNNVRTDVEELAVDMVDIAGATTAELHEFRFSTAQGDAVHHFDLFVLTPEGQLLYGRSEAPVDSADPAQLRAILESVEVADGS
ncbi:hypothetical protein [Euzebya tangerina]|uniref:hypothetical protein n=1 Tax=Euzebya tangerina TaxID=591198 RepID=UPI000E31427B|nr:hypothetical protein [Euzebya tangerina]